MSSFQAIRNVLIIGASGKLGPSIVKAFRAAGDFKLSILSRSPTSGRFGPEVTEIQTDYSFDSLKNAFKSQDAVICSLGGAAAHLQGTIIEAASASNVKRYIPSEFGIDSMNTNVQQRLPVAKNKAAIISQLQKTSEANPSFSWTALYVGALFDLVLATGFIGLDLDSRKAIIYDGGDTKFPATSMDVVGEALVHILRKPEETANKSIYFKELWTTTNEIVSALRQLEAPKEWSVTADTTGRALAEGRHKLAEKDIAGGLSLMMRSIYFDKSLQSAIAWETEEESALLSPIPRQNVTELVAATLKEKHGQS